MSQAEDAAVADERLTFSLHLVYQIRRSHYYLMCSSVQYKIYIAFADAILGEFVQPTMMKVVSLIPTTNYRIHF